MRNGELVSCDLKNKDGTIYYSLFMAKDNRQQRWHFVDENGETIWL